MDKEKVSKIIGQIESLLDDLKSKINIPVPDVPNKGGVKAIKKKGRSKKSGSTKPVQGLIGAGFFNTPKTDMEVVAVLKKKALIFKRADIAVTLMRFVKKDVLEREGSGTKSDSWKYRKK